MTPNMFYVCILCDPAIMYICSHPYMMISYTMTIDASSMYAYDIDDVSTYVTNPLVGVPLAALRNVLWKHIISYECMLASRAQLRACQRTYTYVVHPYMISTHMHDSNMFYVCILCDHGQYPLSCISCSL